MQTKFFRIPGADVQSLLAGSGTQITARVLGNYTVAQHGDMLAAAIAAELVRGSRRVHILAPEASERFGGHDLTFTLDLHVPSMGWMTQDPMGVSEREILEHVARTGRLPAKLEFS